MVDDDIVIAADGRRLRPVKSVARALELLDVLAEEQEPMGVTELAVAAGCSKTAAYNLITTLELKGLVRRTGDNRYLLGWRLLELGDVVRVSSSFGDSVRDGLDSLAELAGETALLSVLDSLTVICVEQAASRRSISTRFATGRREPAETSASGHVLLAYATAGRRRRFVDSQAPELADAWLERFDGVRNVGLAVVRDVENHQDVSIAAPVFDYSGDVVASLALVGPATRIPVDRVDELSGVVREAAGEVSMALGAVSPGGHLRKLR